MCVCVKTPYPSSNLYTCQLIWCYTKSACSFILRHKSSSQNDTFSQNPISVYSLLECRIQSVFKSNSIHIRSVVSSRKNCSYKTHCNGIQCTDIRDFNLQLSEILKTEVMNMAFLLFQEGNVLTVFLLSNAQNNILLLNIPISWAHTIVLSGKVE